MKRLSVLMCISALSLMLVSCGKANNSSQSNIDSEPSPEITAAQENAEVTPDTAASATENESESTSESIEENTALQNNDSYFVGVDQKVYFRVPKQSGMNRVALFDSFLSEMNGDTDLLSYNTKSGEVEFHQSDMSAYGPMSKCGDIIFYENNAEYDSFGDNILTYHSISDNKDITNDSVGLCYLCGSDDGKYFVAIKHLSETGSELYIYNDEQNEKYIGQYPVENFYTAVGISGDTFFYIACQMNDNYCWDYYLWSLDMINNNATMLGALPEIETGSFAGEIDQFEDDGEGNICFSYSYYEGTGHFLYSTFAVAAKANTENSLVSSELGITEYEETPTFMLDQSSTGYKLTEGIPNTAGFKDGKLGYFDSMGDFVPLTDATLWDQDYHTENAIVYEQYGYVYGDVYAVRDYLIRYRIMDIGWRSAFYRQKVEIVKFDGTTGEEEIIHTVEAPADITLPVCYDGICGKWVLDSFSVESDEMFSAEEMGEYESMNFNYDNTVDYSQRTSSGVKLDAQYEVIEDGQNIYFEYEQEYGPKRFNIIGKKPDGNLVLQIKFYYNDGTTGSEYALYKWVDY